MERKALTVKDVTGSGEVHAIIATLKAWDKDGDWTEPGYFGSQHTSILGGHDWSDLQLGKGVVTDESGSHAEFQGRINLDIPEGERLHAKLRFDMDNPPPLIEWSYGMFFNEGGTTKGTRDGRDGRILQPLPDGSPGARIPEVSPVVVGAGVGTGTSAVKSAMKLIDHITATRSDVQALTERVLEVVTLRAEKGQHLGTATKAALAELTEAFNEVADAVASDNDEPPTQQADTTPRVTVDDLLVLAQTETRLRGSL